jgi:hypothetical protein
MKFRKFVWNMFDSEQYCETVEVNGDKVLIAHSLAASPDDYFVSWERTLEEMGHKDAAAQIRRLKQLGFQEVKETEVTV